MQKIIIFFCEWSSYPGLQLSQPPAGATESGKKFLVSMCQGRISPELVLDAFSNGAWGVMLACCPPDECEHDANYKAMRRISLLKSVLGQFGIEPQRLKLEQISKGEIKKFKTAADGFEKEIEKLGPISGLKN